jgi:hypothetical protein
MNFLSCIVRLTLSPYPENLSRAGDQRVAGHNTGKW